MHPVLTIGGASHSSDQSDAHDSNADPREPHRPTLPADHSPSFPPLPSPPTLDLDVDRHPASPPIPPPQTSSPDAVKPTAAVMNMMEKMNYDGKLLGQSRPARHPETNSTRTHRSQATFPSPTSVHPIPAPSASILFSLNCFVEFSRTQLSPSISSGPTNQPEDSSISMPVTKPPMQPV